MRLELDETDLLDEYKDVSTSGVTFKHMKKEVQRVVALVGRATFYRNRGVKHLENYNAIYPPRTVEK